MAFEMIDGDERNAQRVREALSAGDADEQRADETWPGGDGDAVDVAPRRVRIGECTIDERKKMLQMLARGDFRNDAAERTVPLHLRRNQIHAHPAVLFEQRDRRLVARSFDSEDHDLRSDGSRFPAGVLLPAAICELRTSHL